MDSPRNQRVSEKAIGFWYPIQGGEYGRGILPRVFSLGGGGGGRMARYRENDRRHTEEILYEMVRGDRNIANLFVKLDILIQHPAKLPGVFFV